ncbi:MAG: hypothetical protein ACYC1C_11600 [Chloroflexota bacterium]
MPVESRRLAIIAVALAATLLALWLQTPAEGGVPLPPAVVSAESVETGSAGVATPSAATMPASAHLVIADPDDDAHSPTGRGAGAGLVAPPGQRPARSGRLPAPAPQSVAISRRQVN